MMHVTWARGGVGEAQGQDFIVRRNVPCSREPLNAVVSEQGHSEWASQQWKFEMHADPDRQVTPLMYLTDENGTKSEATDGTEKQRVFKILGVSPKNSTERVLVLLCEELA